MDRCKDRYLTLPGTLVRYVWWLFNAIDQLHCRIAERYQNDITHLHCTITERHSVDKVRPHNQVTDLRASIGPESPPQPRHRIETKPT